MPKNSSKGNGMIKAFILSLFILTASLHSEEAESFTFIGVGLSSQTLKGKDFNVHTPIYSLKYGKQTLEWRTTFSYNFNKNSYKEFVMNVDKILLDRLFGTPKVRPYLGISIGSLSYKSTLLADRHGYHYGASTGLLLYLSDTIDFDINYHYSRIQEIPSLTSFNGFSFSLHYFY